MPTTTSQNQEPASYTSSRFLIDTTSLASKPPQNHDIKPTSSTSTTTSAPNVTSDPAIDSPKQGLPVCFPSSNNYATAQAEAQARAKALQTPTSASIGDSCATTGKQVAQDTEGTEAKSRGQEGMGPAVSWKPGFDRTQSWNEQDMKRKYQERLLNGEEGKKGGFTSSEGS